MSWDLNGYYPADYMKLGVNMERVFEYKMHRECKGNNLFA